MGRRRYFFRHGELHLVLLALLRDEPRHGYELITALGELFGPGYHPSAGSVYPALSALEDEGLVTPTDDGGRRVYRVTPLGEGALRDRERAVASIEARTGVRLASRGLEPLLSGFAARVRGAAPDADPRAVESILEDAARRIESLDDRPEEEP